MNAPRKYVRVQGLTCDGFRVDMADSLVKNDDEKRTGTCRIWKEIRQMLGVIQERIAGHGKKKRISQFQFLHIQAGGSAYRIVISG